MRKPVLHKRIKPVEIWVVMVEAACERWFTRGRTRWFWKDVTCKLCLRKKP